MDICAIIRSVYSHEAGPTRWCTSCQQDIDLVLDSIITIYGHITLDATPYQDNDPIIDSKDAYVSAEQQEYRNKKLVAVFQVSAVRHRHTPTPPPPPPLHYHYFSIPLTHFNTDLAVIVPR